MCISKRGETSHAQDFANPLELSTIGGWIQPQLSRKTSMPPVALDDDPHWRSCFSGFFNRQLQNSSTINHSNHGWQSCFWSKSNMSFPKKKNALATAVGRKVVYNVMQFVKDHPPSARPRCRGVDLQKWWRYRGVHKWGYPKWIIENHTKMDDLGVPPFQETSLIIWLWMVESSLGWHSQYK